MKRIHLIITGDVQDVGFRSWTKRQSRELDLVGWVKNRSDGSVEIVAEGKRGQLDEFIKRCNLGPEASWVENVTVSWEEGSASFVSFDVVP